MTLSPVFRSEKAVRLLEEHGLWDRLSPALATQIEAVQTIHADLGEVIGEQFIDPNGRVRQEDQGEHPELAFLQDYFFLTLFLSIFESLGVEAPRLPFYAQLNYCIMGTITAADNLFDDQDKRHLPLAPASGARYRAIMELMCFERLTRRAGERAVAQGLFPIASFERAHRGLLDQMAEIGRLEGSEEGGVDEIPEPAAMIDAVHRVRGGMLFQLAFVGPRELETGAPSKGLGAAEEAIRRLGTAFQIVDDLTDFEFDLGRRSHNLLAAEIRHGDDAEARAMLERLWQGEPAPEGLVEGMFAESARRVLEHAYAEARASFETLAAEGFWFPPEQAEEVVHAIVGLDGLARIAALTDSKTAAVRDK